MSAPAGASPALRRALHGFEPTPEQWAAITHPLEPLHLVAGAGAGKTAVMAARIVWIVETHGVLPSQVLGLTFTNKASEELLERVRNAVGVGTYGADTVVQTYNAFAAGIVRDHGLLAGVEPEAGLLTEAQQWQLVLSCLDDVPPFEAIELRSPAALVKDTLALASSLADHIVAVADVDAAADRVLASANAPEAVERTARKRKELCRVVEAYRRAKARSGRIDFGDQVTKAVEILEGHADVRAAFRARWPVVLLDEYQDTNVAQRRLIQAVVERGGAVTAVGDARQAIYAFRGATMYNLIGFPEHFPRASGTSYRELSLSENFRSGRRILAVANRIVARIDPERRPGDDLRPHEPNGDGAVSLGLFADEHAEASWIARRCEELHGTPAAGGRAPVQWRDIAILVRRKASMDTILQALEERDVPVEVVGIGGLLKTPEVTEIVAWLRCLETKPSANRWLARILLGPRWRVHYRDLALCARWAAGRNLDLRTTLAGGDADAARDVEPGDVGFSLLESLAHLDEIEGLGADAKQRLGAFARRLARVQEKATGPLLDLVQEVVRTSGLADALDASRARAAASAKQNVANLLDHVAAFAPVEGDATLRSFLAYLDAADDAEETLEATQPADQDSVKLMTVHAAKGLEFECVFVPSVAAGRGAGGDYKWSVFPNTRASNPLTSYTELPYEVREDSGHLPRWTGKLGDFSDAVTERALEDERRLFYVALTRAKQRLAVTAAWWYGRDRTPKGPSMFWDELDAMSADGLVDVVARADQPDDNPVVGVLEGRRAWPPAPRAGADDELFPEGWGAAADAVVRGDASFDDLLARLAEPERDAARAALRRHVADLDVIDAARRRAADPAAAETPIVSATDYARVRSGRGDAYDGAGRELPSRPTAARRIGTEIHRVVEEHTRGISPYAEEHELDEPAAAADLRSVARALGRWSELGYDERTVASLPSGQPMIELPFALRVDGSIVRGRIDVVFETDDGGLEIVDYKTGERFDVGETDQLEVYALALHANGLVPPGATVTLTYAFLLDDGEPVTRVWSPAPATTGVGSRS
ncbi:MAG TPA: ATP-dependent DNA helicase [Actinomycetota bacterium]|nr:ATP-dependent DNA helicase [Actinomycetota bacterium]